MIFVGAVCWKVVQRVVSTLAVCDHHEQKNAAVSEAPRSDTENDGTLERNRCVCVCVCVCDPNRDAYAQDIV